MQIFAWWMRNLLFRKSLLLIFICIQLMSPIDAYFGVFTSWKLNSLRYETFWRQRYWVTVCVCFFIVKLMRFIIKLCVTRWGRNFATFRFCSKANDPYDFRQIPNIIDGFRTVSNHVGWQFFRNTGFIVLISNLNLDNIIFYVSGIFARHNSLRSLILPSPPFLLFWIQVCS